MKSIIVNALFAVLALVGTCSVSASPMHRNKMYFSSDDYDNFAPLGAGMSNHADPIPRMPGPLESGLSQLNQGEEPMVPDAPFKSNNMRPPTYPSYDVYNMDNDSERANLQDQFDSVAPIPMSMQNDDELHAVSVVPKRRFRFNSPVRGSNAFADDGEDDDTGDYSIPANRYTVQGQEDEFDGDIADGVDENNDADDMESIRRRLF